MKRSPTSIGEDVGFSIFKGVLHSTSVADGLALESQAAKCAEIFGLPFRVVERARHVRYALQILCSDFSLTPFSRLISDHKICQLLDEEMGENERNDLEEAEQICRRFLQWNLEEDSQTDVRKRLADVLGRKGED